jgi:hypothetical protein
MQRREMDGHLGNKLLGRHAGERLCAHREKSTTFEQGLIIQGVGEFIERIYFPQTGMISLLVQTKDGGGIEASKLAGPNRGPSGE